MKKLFFILSIFIIINHNNAYSNLNSISCENLLTKNKANIVYGNNFAKEEMSPNIWLFFHKVSLDEIISDKKSQDYCDINHIC